MRLFIRHSILGGMLFCAASDAAPIKFSDKGGETAVQKDGEKAAKDPPAIQLNDVDGRVQSPLSHRDQKAVVLFFLLSDCPISNAYAPEIQRICADYKPKKINLFVVHADPAVSAETAKKHAKDYGLSCPVLLDPMHLLVKKTGVAMAPEVAVVGPDGKVLYRGRIDDVNVDYGKRRAEPTQRDLRNALDAVLQGKAVPTPATKVIGCDLPEPKQ